MEYTKPFLTFEQQADRLVERGVQADKAVLIEHLKDVDYYRLSGYWHVFKNPDNGEFVDGTTFEDVWRLYTFDRQFRLVVLDALERVEVYMRTQLAYILAEKGGAFGYEDKRNLPRMRDRYNDFMSKCRKAFNRSREPFVMHFKEKYGDEHALPPYWMLVNIMDFGMVVSLYKGAPVDVRNKIASSLGVTSKVLDSWLVTLNTVRNICAHHGRLWNRQIGTKPRIPNVEKDVRWHKPYEVSNGKVFGTLTILSCLLTYIAPNTHWRERLFNLIDGMDEEHLESMGLAEGWQECPFWKPWVEDGEPGEDCV